MKNCSGVYEQNNVVDNVRKDDWTAKLTIIASNAAPSVLDQRIN